VHSDSSSSSGTADNDKPVKRLATGRPPTDNPPKAVTADNDKPVKRLATGRPPTDNPPKAVTAHADSNATGTECSVCGLVTKDLVHCRNNHAFCIDDFSKFINVDIINYRQRFISNGSRLYCPTCSPQLSTLSSRRGKDGDFARKCASQLSDDVFEKWLGCVTEPAVIAAQQECEARYLRAVKPKPASQNPDDNTVGKMMVSFSFLHHLTPPLLYSCRNITHH
jgi:hypothetical protein